ncbi:hypothetical protein pEaSNUABM40_00316 [Erwinia phage pEa_SNUABM_40]|uniref:Uncharacterized protein n=1 Tax=Erwinia phage pEa_SNUABM_3 TaxID=2869552 RepID=A0AAE7XHK7_9CAUD|nr:hypothetical protein MPK68_gp314 [Erwinia phage pEa_SNUABM_3]QZE56848.1 hypothetical protein pEaSNUABM20_00312 [Erwinia phage pEa_SNUABM_20]QZE58532.1 hypothetical protein pEaSNUABM40_00316 [Erwinia phage pEa_SNUABM_40]UAW53093.1 hypothetical protein pEaSNUABM23_00311 [Erwinia phage pEa_SNUABM_23]UIW10988.1 hypothetical protein pEaSNUABM23_00311 [Erwinia phage pEa_SNUABM_31]QZE56511.1 hypothetical protein pEaSNUABM3_00314 [Erwinia phage pEa_SNUABM_3]
MQEHKATPADIELQDRMMEAGVQRIIELKPEWIDVCTAGLRLYLTVCDQIGGPIPELRFVHNSKPCRIQFNLNESAEGTEFTANDIDHEKQMAICDAILDVADANEDGHSLLDLAICSGRLFMIGYDGLAGTVEKVCFRFAKKNYTMNLVKGE